MDGDLFIRVVRYVELFTRSFLVASLFKVF